MKWLLLGKECGVFVIIVCENTENTQLSSLTKKLGSVASLIEDHRLCAYMTEISVFLFRDSTHPHGRTYVSTTKHSAKFLTQYFKLSAACISCTFVVRFSGLASGGSSGS